MILTVNEAIDRIEKIDSVKDLEWFLSNKETRGNILKARYYKEFLLRSGEKNNFDDREGEQLAYYVFKGDYFKEIKKNSRFKHKMLKNLFQDEDFLSPEDIKESYSCFEI